MSPQHTCLSGCRTDVNVLSDSIELALRRRAWELVENLRVDREEDRLVIRGASASYYGLQLVIEATRAFVQSDLGIAVVLDVRVPAEVGASPKVVDLHGDESAPASGQNSPRMLAAYRF